MLTRATLLSPKPPTRPLRKYEDRRNRSQVELDVRKVRSLLGVRGEGVVQDNLRVLHRIRGAGISWVGLVLKLGRPSSYSMVRGLRRPRVAEIQLQSGRVKRPCHQSHAVRRTSGSISTTRTNPLLDQWISRILVYLRIPVLPPSSSNSSRYTASPNRH